MRRIALFGILLLVGDLLAGCGDKTPAAHPFDLFRLPGWSGSPKFARKTLLAGPSRPPSHISKVVMISSRQPK